MTAVAAIKEVDDRPYTRLYPREGLPMSTRRLSVWNEMITAEPGGQPQPRFAFIGHETPVG